MKRALVLFGSTSDKLTYDRLFENLKEKYELDLKIISAHRNPDELDIQLKKDNFDFILAGAGIAAHLPGVCASKTNKPVFGIPVRAYLDGLDAYLSIAQMPFGVPVATVFVKNIKDLIDITSKKKGINLYWNKKLEEIDSFSQEIERVDNFISSNDLKISKNQSFQNNMINIKLVSDVDQVEEQLGQLYVPLLSHDEKKSPMSALKVLECAQKSGFWFGANNTRNAILFAQKLLNQ